MIKNPCALLINDIHVSKDNIPEFYKNWEEALDICRQKNIPDLIVGGDLWQARASQTLDVLMAVRHAIMKATQAGITLTIAEGNHCKVDQESVKGYSHLFSEYPNVFVVDNYSVFDLSDKVVLYVMSYFPENGSFTDRLDTLCLDLDPNKYNILYCHEGINGALATSSDKELSPKIFSQFDKVLVGHYHNRCKIKNTNIEYIGASRQHNFGEDEEKGYTVMYDDGSYEFIKNQVNMRYIVEEVKPKDLDKIIAKINNRSSLYKTKVRIISTNKEAKTIDRQKLIDAGVSRIEIVTNDTAVQATASSLEHKFDKTGIKKEYSGFCVEKGIDVTMGLEYLDKIN